MPNQKEIYSSENRSIHQTIPDHRVRLTPEGRKQAEEAGFRLRRLLRPDDKLHFFTSPYTRTRETTEGMLNALTSDEPSPSPFKRQTIKVYEEPRLREQDFGNFQPCSAAMERMWQERADYGHFFYRIPNGESAADAYDRISGFNESLWRQFGEDDFASVCVLVTHGLMTRVFLMKWYHFSVEYFEDLRNVNHCEFVVMQRDAGSQKYVLENQLRTWSELRRQQRAIGPASPTATQKQHQQQQQQHAVPWRKKWGGCPDGCTHERSLQHHYHQHDPALRRAESAANTTNATSSTGANAAAAAAAPARNHDASSTTAQAQERPTTPPSQPRIEPSSTTTQKSRLHVPDGTHPHDSESSTHDALMAPMLLSPSRIAMLQAGRDFGGSQSGVASEADSSDEDSRRFDKSHHHHHRHDPHQQPHLNQNAGEDDHSARADALGDHVHQQEGDEEEEEEGDAEERGDVLAERQKASLEELEKNDKSVQGSVY
ncbi:MAG: hypothetical protein M1825_005871 [Sarcosagium campestre]|nr:MAG: hypothetical protein M1825_005871 [Sarcosagium campestre]